MNFPKHRSPLSFSRFQVAHTKKRLRRLRNMLQAALT